MLKVAKKSWSLSFYIEIFVLGRRIMCSCAQPHLLKCKTT